jgi:hypothetical protein
MNLTGLSVSDPTGGPSSKTQDIAALIRTLSDELDADQGRQGGREFGSLSLGLFPLEGAGKAKGEIC